MTNNDHYTLHLPRILCLHGGGTNAPIFRAQCRRLIAQLESEFRFVFAEAPFDSQAGPDVLSVYSRWGPFKRWLRWHEGQPAISHAEAVEEIDHALHSAMENDDIRGATGDWIGLLGFSQGAKVAASVLYQQQMHQNTKGLNLKNKFKFGVLFAGRAPLVWLESDVSCHHGFSDASQISSTQHTSSSKARLLSDGLLQLPTIHIHGLQDEGLDSHRELLEYCDPRSTRLVELNLGHRLPLKSQDVGLVVNQIRETMRRTEKDV